MKKENRVSISKYIPGGVFNRTQVVHNRTIKHINGKHYLTYRGYTYELKLDDQYEAIDFYEAVKLIRTWEGEKIQ